MAHSFFKSSLAACLSVAALSAGFSAGNLNAQALDQPKIELLKPNPLPNGPLRPVETNDAKAAPKTFPMSKLSDRPGTPPSEFFRSKFGRGSKESKPAELSEDKNIKIINDAPEAVTARSVNNPSAKGYGEPNFLQGLSEIQTKVIKGQRASLVDFSNDISRKIEENKAAAAENEVVDQFHAQKEILSTVVSDSVGTLNRVQSAVVSATANADVRELVEGKTQKPVVITEKVSGAAFNVEVTYRRKGEGDEATLVREVNLVAKSEAELKKSENPVIRGLAADPKIQPVLKDAVDAMVEQVKDPLNKFMSEPEIAEQKISDIDPNKGPKVETNLASDANKEAMKTSMDQAEKEVSDQLANAEKKRDLAVDDAQSQSQVAKATQLFAEWAIKNPDEAKKMNKCEMAAKALDLNPKAAFDMLDQKTREECKDLAKREIGQMERGVLDPNSLGKGGSGDMKNAQDKDKQAQIGMDQMKQQTIQTMMQVVQACFNLNTAAADSVDKLKQQIQPMYNAIAGFDKLEEMVKSSEIATNVLSKMQEGEDSDIAAIETMSEVKSVYPDTDEGNRLLYAEMRKLFRIKGKLSAYREEFEKRSEEMARAMGNLAVDQFKQANAQMVTAAANGDQNAQQALAAKSQEIYAFAYQKEKRDRANEPANLQQSRYQDAFSAASAEVSALYSAREARWKTSGTVNWVNGGSSPVVNSARNALRTSPALRSNENVSVTVDNAFARTPANLGVASPTMNNTGNLRSTGAPAPTQININTGTNNPANGVNQQHGVNQQRAIRSAPSALK